MICFTAFVVRNRSRVVPVKSPRLNHLGVCQSSRRPLPRMACSALLGGERGLPKAPRAPSPGHPNIQCIQHRGGAGSVQGLVALTACSLAGTCPLSGGDETGGNVAHVGPNPRFAAGRAERHSTMNWVFRCLFGNCGRPTTSDLEQPRRPGMLQLQSADIRRGRVRGQKCGVVGSSRRSHCPPRALWSRPFGQLSRHCPGEPVSARG
jgi:hypothetical protein